MITVTGSSLTVEEIVAVARRREAVQLSPSVRDKVDAARAVVDRYVAEKKIAYGVTTGVGELRDEFISPQDVARLQHNLMRSHACGVGEPLPVETVRAMALVRINMLAQGYSGVRYELVSFLVELLNRGVHPVIPEHSGTGSSGSLSASAHFALVLLGEGEAFFEGQRLPGAEALRRAGLSPIELAPKEGLSLINGTHLMTGMGALALADTLALASQTDVALALSLEALNGRPDAFDARLHGAKRYPGQQHTAANVRRLIAGSDLYDRPPTTTQDAYSLRCGAQIQGAVREALAYVRHTVEAEANSAADNPLVFSQEGDIVSGGNFHGEAVAFALDTLAMACSELGDISERRTARLVDRKLSGLPAFLTRAGGLNSGLMIPQYVAVSLVSENKVLAGPASIDSIPTSANQEDLVSGGTVAALKVGRIVANVQYVLAIELMCAAQALDLQPGRRLGKGTAIAHQFLRQHVPTLEEDRILAGDIERFRDLIRAGELLAAVGEAVGSLY